MASTTTTTAAAAATAADWIGHEKMYYSCLDWPTKTCCGLSNKGQTYELTSKRLTISEQKGCCCFQQYEQDNVDRDSIIDADLHSIPAPGLHLLCCACPTEVVTLKTRGKEVKTLRLPHDQGQVLVNKIVGRE